jgi:hypothetical protein
MLFLTAQREKREKGRVMFLCQFPLIESTRESRQSYESHEKHEKKRAFRGATRKDIFESDN